MGKFTSEMVQNLRIALLENLPECQYYAVSRIKQAGIDNYKDFYNDTFLKQLKVNLESYAPNVISSIGELYSLLGDEECSAKNCDKHFIEAITTELFMSIETDNLDDNTPNAIRWRLYQKIIDEVLFVGILRLYDLYFYTLEIVLEEASENN